MKKLGLLAVAVAAGLTAGCATIIDGSSQKMAISTTPPGARCELSRAGSVLAVVPVTPGNVQFDKSKNDVTMQCAKEPFVTSDTSYVPRFTGVTFVNLVLGGVIGFLVDAATGANYALPDKLDVALAPAVAKPTAALKPGA